MGFERRMIGAPEMEHLTLKRLRETASRGGLFYWGPWKTSYIGFGYGNHHRGPFTAEQNLESGRRFIYWGF